jgi:hypothetical protein
LTFKELRKIISLSDEKSKQQQSKLFERLRYKRFWIWDLEGHRLEDIKTKGDCCFNHIIGLPKKEGVQKPLFDYQKTLCDTLLIPSTNSTLKHDFKYKHLWVKKATGLGVTELFLRLMVWLCLKGDTYRNSQMCIVTGPNQDIAIKLIRRMKALFEPFNITFANKETVLELNGCTIEAFPSNHLDAYRALDNPKFILLDEADFFRKSEQEDVRHVSERYIGKSDPYIVMVSTPNAPDGLFESIENEPEETCIYKRLKLDYTFGLDKIYTRQEIEKAKQSPSFGREYDLRYLGLIGNAFHQLDIDAAITDMYDPTDRHSISTFYGRSMGLDPGYGSSPFAIVITQFRDGYIEVLFAEEYDRPLQNEIIERVIRLNNKHHIGRILVDASNAGFISSLKQQIGDFDYKSYVQNDRVMKHIDDSRLRSYSSNVIVFPVNFGTMHGEMLFHVNSILSARRLRIHPSFNKLITSLRTAQVLNDKWSLDKDQTSYNDILDSFRLSLLNYYFAAK